MTYLQMASYEFSSRIDFELRFGSPSGLSHRAVLRLSSQHYYNAYQSVRYTSVQHYSSLQLSPHYRRLAEQVLKFDLDGSFDRSIPAKCLDFNAVAFSNGAIGILQDLIILVLPFPEVVHLTMITRKKIILILMFLLGSFAVLTSIIRLNYLHTFATSTDQTCR